MASRELIETGAGAAVLATGVLIEVATTHPPAAGALDWLVGAAFVLAALRRRHLAPAETVLGLATAAAWFAASAAVLLPEDVAWLAAAATVAYRGPLIHWITRRAAGAPSGTIPRVLLACGYATSVVPTRAAALGTALVAVTLAFVLLRLNSHRPADARHSARQSAVLLLLLGCLWLGTALNFLATVAQPVSVTVLLLVAWRLSRSPGADGLDQAVSRLVVDLGPSDRPATPVLATLARALADPGLRLALSQATTDWTDELGRPAPDPLAGTSSHRLTQVPALDGGMLVLIHGPGSAGDSELARIAAAAAALGLRRARLDTELRRQGEQIQRSAVRLLAVNDMERRALAERLRCGPVARLDELRRQWRGNTGDQALADELDQILAELDRLAHGLAPESARPEVLAPSLERLAANLARPVALDLGPDLPRLPVDMAALVYFVTAECLTNIARHSQASAATVTIRYAESLKVEITDNGVGGAAAKPGRGLQGLADRVLLAGGALSVDSPGGGPTRVRVELPIATRGPATNESRVK